ncbi:protein Daple-like isoform X2 [Atheta coriaria]|uniref:protein Daple-like isoform X2 n=1 Tax=Dalotia coriaria TaxID=877792 RepID=UPI0031F3AD27
MKEEQLSAAEEIKTDLLRKIEDLKDINNNMQEANNCLTVEKDKISKLLQEHLRLQSQAMLNNSAQKQPNFASPPGLFVVERSETRKPSADLDNSFDECCNDEDMMPTAPEYLTQASLKEELQLSSPTSSSIDSEMSSSNCFGNSEVKKRLDDLYDQIDWLKIENTSLKQSKEDVVELIQTKLHLESVNKERDQTIVDLNKTLKVAKNNEEELTHQCADLKEKLQNLEEIKRNFDIITKEITVLKDNIQVLKDDKDKLIKENSVNESMIERLKDNLKTLENAKKCLELKINNIQAEKDILIEEHKIHIDQYSTKIEQYQSDITKLEKKFYASNDQVTSLLATNEESATTNAKLFLQHQKLVDVHQELQADYQYYTQTINATCTKDLSTRHKLQLLIKAKDSYSKLETRLELLIQEKQKESVDLNSKIIELEKKCAQLNRNTPRKTPHDRAQLKIEKLREKVDHLEDTLKKEKSKQASLQEEQEQLQKCNDSLIKEKIIILKETEESKRNLDKLQNTYSELFDVVKNILSGSLKLRHNMLKLSKLWKPLFDKVSAVGGLVKYLGEDDRNNHCSLKEIIQAQNDIQTITLILDALGTYNLHGFINGGKPVEEQNVLKNFDFLSRPMSPDSPNLGSIDVVASIGAGDSLVNCVGVLEDSEGCEADVDIGPGSEEDDFTDRLKDLHKMYSSDHLEFLMTNVGLEKSCENLDLQAFVDDFALTFMVDCTGYKNRLLGQFEVLQETVTRLVEHLQTFTTLGSDLKRRNLSMVALVRCLFELTKSAEQYGAIQQEIQSSQNINCLITHITNLRELKDNRKMAAARLRGETVYVDNLHGSPSGDNQLCEGPQNHLMSMLNAMRPANVVRLLHPIYTAVVVGAEMPFAGRLGWIFWPLVLDGCARMDPRPSRWQYHMVHRRENTSAM